MNALGEFAELQKMRRRQLTTLDISSRVEIVEKRAPTDESVRLLSEMERAAQDKLVMAMGCDAMPFKCTAHVFENHANQRLDVRIRFSLGETQHDFTVECDMWDHRDKKTLVLFIRDQIAKEVANVITIGPFMEAARFLK